MAVENEASASRPCVVLAHAEDRHAGRLVAGILTGILTLGLILYVVVLFIVSS